MYTFPSPWRRIIFASESRGQTIHESSQLLYCCLLVPMCPLPRTLCHSRHRATPFIPPFSIMISTRTFSNPKEETPFRVACSPNVHDIHHPANVIREEKRHIPQQVIVSFSVWAFLSPLHDRICTFI